MPFWTLYYEIDSDSQKVVNVGQAALSRVIWKWAAELRLQLQPPSVLLDILLSIHKHSHQNEDVNIGAPFISDSINWFKCPKYQNDPGWSHRVQLIFSSVLLWWSSSALRCLRDLAALKVSYLIDCLWAEVHSILPRVWIQSAAYTRRGSHVAVVFVSCQVVHEFSLWCQSLG